MTVWSRLWTFQAQKPEEYEGIGPIMDIREHLNGPIACEGVIYGPTGRVTSRFVAEFFAQWDGNTGVMREHFRYDSGSTQDREWRLTLSDDGQVVAEADDLVGVGDGRQAGPTLKLNYTIKLTQEAGGHALNVTDWMYLMENGTIMNRSQFRKFGIKVAELVATMRPMTVEQEKKEAA
nr:DUF3833 family protein [Nereida sp. MMG025]